MAMIVLDANILIYAWNKSDPHHEPAKEWVTNLFSGDEWVGIPWVTIWAFLRLTTNRRIFPNPVATEHAFAIVRSWLELPNLVVVQPGPRHEELLKGLVIRGQAAGPLLTDAVLAALAIEQGATLASTDQDFSRFPELSWINPLSAKPA